jgi:acetyltransferase
MKRCRFRKKVVEVAGIGKVLLRLLEKGDAPLLVELFYVLSPETIYNRFLTPVKQVDETHLKRLVEIDQWNEVAIASCIHEGDKERIIGVARFARLENPEEAEVAIVVGDPWQGKGLGSVLLKTIGDVAVKNGVRRFYSTVDPNNRRLLCFAKRFGFDYKCSFENGLLRLVTDLRSG